MILKRNVQRSRHNIQLELGQRRKQDPGHSHRIHISKLRHNILIAAVLLNEPHIESCIVSHQNCIPHKIQELLQHHLNARRIHHHLVRNPGQLRNLKRDRYLGIDKGTEPLCDLPPLYFHCSDFYDLIFDGTEPCGLKIKDNIHVIQGLSSLTHGHILQIVHKIAFHAIDYFKRVILIKPFQKMIGVRESLHHSMVCDRNRLMPPVIGSL